MERTAVTGAPRSGKSTLLKVVGRLSSTTKHTHTVYSVPDDVLVRIADAEGSARVTPLKLSFEEIEARSYARMRESDCIVLVVRAQDRQGAVEAAQDCTAQARRWVQDAILEDMALVEGALPRLEKIAASGDRQAAGVVEASNELLALLEAQDLEAARVLSKDSSAIPKEWGLLCAKPLVVVVNLDESLAGAASDVQRYAAEELGGVAAAVEASPLAVEAELAEVAETDPETASEMASEFSIGEPIAARLASRVLGALGLIVFYTANENEARAWSLPEGSTVLEAAGRIHSDMQRGFIRAEVIPAPQLLEAGSLKEARRRGEVRVEGKSYAVKPGDVIFVRFNV